MKRLFLLTLSLVCLADAAHAQEEDAKTRINRIKRDTSYLCGEATMPSREEAMTLAKDFLRSYIEQWIAETRETQSIRSVVARDLVADCEELSLMRGSMFRAFVYVNKRDLYAVDTNAVSIPVKAPSGGETAAGGGVSAGADAAEAPAAGTVAAAETLVAAEASAAGADAAVPDDAPSSSARPGSGPAETVAVAGAGATVAAAQPGSLATGSSGPDQSVPGASACETAIPAAPGTPASEMTVPSRAGAAGNVSEPMPAASADEAARAFYDQLVRDLCGMQSKPEVERLLRSETYASACTFGDVGYATRPQDIEKGILVIYKSGSDAVSALLSPKSPKRTNLRTGREDSTVNYPGCRAMWICLK